MSNSRYHQHESIDAKKQNESPSQNKTRKDTVEEPLLHHTPENIPENIPHETTPFLEDIIKEINALEDTHLIAPHASLEPIIEQYEYILDEVKTLLEAKDLERHHLHPLLHTLHATLIHTEAAEHRDTESEKKSHFLDHHAEALQHTNEQWFHQQHLMEIEDEEDNLEAEYGEILKKLQAYQHRIKQMIETAERDELDKKRRHTLEPHPVPKPPVDPIDDDKT